MLPCDQFHESWETLIYDITVKRNLLQYVTTMMDFSERGVNSNLICINRVVLLHGPPGTGKTSLCKALAQKLSIRLKDKYEYSQLIEINSHSLFSKWFSESGKLVNKMFSKIYELVENPKIFVCVLIDEVESLALARNNSIGANEPSDGLRVVNAVLTQIDQIRKYPNVLILTTSNMTNAIDVAFIDRADIKQYIGLPSIHAIYQLYYSSLQELQRISVISRSETVLPPKVMQMENIEQNCVCERSKKLMKICEMSLGFSGRTLRKIPFVAHALFSKEKSVTLETFLNSMIQGVEFTKKEKTHFENF